MAQFLMTLLLTGIVTFSVGYILFRRQQEIHRNQLANAIALQTPRPKTFGLSEAIAVMTMAPEGGLAQDALLWFRSVVTDVLGYEFTVAKEAQQQCEALDALIKAKYKDIDGRLMLIDQLRSHNLNDGNAIDFYSRSQKQCQELATTLDPPVPICENPVDA